MDCWGEKGNLVSPVILRTNTRFGSFTFKGRKSLYLNNSRQYQGNGRGEGKGRGGEGGYRGGREGVERSGAELKECHIHWQAGCVSCLLFCWLCCCCSCWCFCCCCYSLFLFFLSVNILGEIGSFCTVLYLFVHPLPHFASFFFLSFY